MRNYKHILNSWIGQYSIEKRKDIRTILIFVFILIIFFSKTFLSTYIHGDFIAYWVPNYYFILQSLQSGSIPLWQPYSYMGVPELFKLDLLLFYPGTWILFAINLLFNQSGDLNFLGKTMELLQYSYLLISSIGMYFLLKYKFELSRVSSFFGSIVYSFSIFMTSVTGDMSSLPGKAYLPLIIYGLISFLKNSSFKNYIILVLLNYLLLTFGYPYNYLYFFIAQLGLAALFGVKKLLQVCLLLFNAILIASFFLLPYLHILNQSYRGAISTINDPFFHLSYAFTPTKVVNILNPQVFANLFDAKDPYLLFTMGTLSWGVFPLIFLIIGIVNFKKSRLNTWLILVFIFSFVFSLGGYLGVPELLGTVLPVVEKLRSHWQILILTFFAGVVILSQGVDKSLKGIQNNKTLFSLWQIAVLLTVYLLTLPFWCRACTTESTDVAISIARTTILLGIGLLLFYLTTKNKSIIFLIAGLTITLFEFNFYFQNIPYLQMGTAYKDYYSVNSLIHERPTNENLFRYLFAENQFAYNTSFLGIFSANGYESVPYQAFYDIDRMDEARKLQFSNVKYIVTTEANKEQQDPLFKFIKSIEPRSKPNETFISSTPNLPYWSEKSDKTHYIYELQNFLPRFFVPQNVRSCTNTDCYSKENSPELVFVKNEDIYIDNPTPKDVAIKIVKYTPNEIELIIDTPKNTFISSSEVWDKGWMIKINDKKSVLHNSSNGFRGFEVLAGENRIRMYYIPPNLYLGILSSILGVSLLIIIYKFFSSINIINDKK